MKHLVMRDMKLLGLMNLVILGIGILGGCVGALGFGDEGLGTNFLYVIAIVAMWFLVNTLITTKEFESKPDSLILSLPVKKFDIVKSRYLTMIIYIFGTLSIMFLISNIGKILFHNMPGSPLTLLGIFVIGAIMLILTSVYIPFQYYDQKNSQFFLVIIQLLVVATPNIMERFGINIDDSSFIKIILELDFNIVGLILLAVALISYVTSLFTSKAIYEAKEF